MTVGTRRVLYGGKPIAFTVQRRKRKTLEIAVESNASAAVVAPLDATEGRDRPRRC